MLRLFTLLDFFFFFFFFQAEDGIRDKLVTGVQTCALPIYVSGGDYVREYVRAQAVGEGAAVGRAAGGAGDGGRIARRCAECRAWGQGEIGRASCRERG